MTRDRLINALRELAEATQAADELPAAGILFSLCGAMAEGTEMELFEVCAQFSQKQVDRLRGDVDWSQDTLKV